MAGSTKGRGEKKPQTLLAVLSHPLRVQILEVLNERTMSPSEFVEKGLFPRHMFRNRQQALSLASYHFRELEKAELLTIVETIPKRGATEHIYGGLIAQLSERLDFSELPLADRQEHSIARLLGLAARADTALRSGKFDNRLDRQLEWMPANLDGQGWDDLMQVLEDAFRKAEEISGAAAARLNSSSEKPIPTVVGVLGFESSPAGVPALTDDAPPALRDS